MLAAVGGVGDADGQMQEPVGVPLTAERHPVCGGYLEPAHPGV